MGTVTAVIEDGSGGSVSVDASYQIGVVQPPASTLMLGATATANAAAGTTSDLAEFLRLEKITGKTLPIRRGFAGPPTPWANHPCGADVGHRVSVASIKTDPVRMRDGLDDALITSFVRSIPVGHRVYLAWQHEASNPKKNLDPATIRAAGAHFAALVKAARGDREVWVTWIEMGWTFSAASGRNPLDWYWGDQAVEVIAPDPYNTRTDKYNALSSESVGGAAYAFAKTHKKRFGVAEFGCYDTAATDRPRFIRDGVAWLRSLKDPSCEFAAWFHSGVDALAGTSGYWLDSSAASLKEWVAQL